MIACRSVILFLSFCYLTAPAVAQPAAPQVSAFSPQGIVKRVRQAQAIFSAPMVPLGDPRLADPFEVSCPASGVGRWVDTRSWVYDFTRDLPAGVRCEFRLRPGLASLDGRPLTGGTHFAFSTGGPAIRGSNPREGTNTIDEEQAFVLVWEHRRRAGGASRPPRSSVTASFFAKDLCMDWRLGAAHFVDLLVDGNIARMPATGSGSRAQETTRGRTASSTRCGSRTGWSAQRLHPTPGARAGRAR